MMPYRCHVDRWGNPKKKYTQDEAYYVLNDVWSERNNLTVYQCDLCGWWHLGNRT